MKIRIHGNSVRARLTRSEVQSLAQGSRVEQVTWFSPTASLISSIEIAAVDYPTVTFNGKHLAVLIPSDQARQWAESPEVAISARQAINEHDSLDVLIEKDFQCLHSSKEDSADAFPNPRI